MRRGNVLITFCVIALLYCLAGRALLGRISESIRLILAIASLSYLPSKYLALAWTSLENGTNTLLVRLLFSGALSCPCAPLSEAWELDKCGSFLRG